MNCPVCARSLAPTLSICPSCGAMMNDTVREELQPKITQRVPVRTVSSTPVAERQPLPPRPAMITPPAISKPQTANLTAPKTSPTLVGFQNKNTSIPDWRLQMQNAVQQRKSTNGSTSDAGHHFPTNGGAALKAEPRREPEVSPEIEDSRVANALRRIEQSREAFFETAAEAKKPSILRPPPARPFGVVAPTHGYAAGAAPAKMPAVAKPKLVVPMAATVMRTKRDTNKLPPLEIPVEPMMEVDNEVIESVGDTTIHSSEFGEIKRIRIKAETESIVADEIDTGYEDEIEDLAPLSMRFGAGLFDLIIATFISMLLLSPIAFSRSDWFTTSGMLVFAGTTAIVTFLYMTICVGFFGKTMGMRLFSLELVDAVENEYPSLQQAAVSSSVFIISLIFAGAGFLTVLFNEERRAAHDLLSGTILVREF